MDQHERIDGLLIFRPPDIKRFSIRRNPARLIRFGIRAQLQRLYRAQAGGGFNQQLPAERV